MHRCLVGLVDFVLLLLSQLSTDKGRVRVKYVVAPLLSQLRNRRKNITRKIHIKRYLSTDQQADKSINACELALLECEVKGSKITKKPSQKKPSVH